MPTTPAKVTVTPAPPCFAVRRAGSWTTRIDGRSADTAWRDDSLAGMLRHQAELDEQIARLTRQRAKAAAVVVSLRHHATRPVVGARVVVDAARSGRVGVVVKVDDASVCVRTADGCAWHPWLSTYPAAPVAAQGGE